MGERNGGRMRRCMRGEGDGLGKEESDEGKRT